VLRLILCEIDCRNAAQISAPPAPSAARASCAAAAARDCKDAALRKTESLGVLVRFELCGVRKVSRKFSSFERARFF
jgi:hypothetical protein